MTKRIALLLLSLAALLFTSRALATDCAVPQLKSSSERADVIFLGVVAAETPTGSGMGIYRLNVERVFKGSVPVTVAITGGGMKGSTFAVGSRYLVFGRLPDATAARPRDLFAHLCGGTQTAERAAEWIATLGPGSAPTGAGSTIGGGATTAVPAAPPSAQPTPSSDAPGEPGPRTEPTVPLPPADNSQATTTTTPGASGGCAGCTAARSEPIASSAGITVLALLMLARRLRRVAA